MNDQAGVSVASAGDLNGDGFDDLIVGARFADAAGNAKNGAGDAYVVFGRAGGFGAAVDLATIAAGQGGFVIHGEDAGDYAGRSVAAAGDLNDDGFDDLVVGASRADGAGNTKGDAGGAYVVFGRASGFGAAIDLGAIAAGQGGFVIHGEDAGDLAGGSVASAGDVNGDGFDDLIIGALGATTYAGAAYVVLGKPGGLSATIDLTTIALGQGGFVIKDDDTFFPGISVSSAGDVDGDGFDDLVVGADSAGDDRLTNSAGGAYVVFGRAKDFGPVLEFGAAARRGFVLRGENDTDDAGNSVASAGDINGDGFDDLIIGAYNADIKSRGAPGAAYVVFGRDTGFANQIDLGTIAAGQGGFIIKGEVSQDNAGISVDSAGDVNGDGFDDLIVGANRANAGGKDGGNAGVAYVVFGRASGFAAVVDLRSIAAGQGGFVLQAEDKDDGVGISVAAAGDVNGDGFDDLIVGAQFADAAGNATRDAGAAYVVFGGTFPGGPDPILGTDAGDVLIGTMAADAVDGLRGQDSLTGREGADTLAGGTGNDRLRGNSGDDLLAGGDNRDVLTGGDGTDTLAGGQDADRFRYARAEEDGDRILDFAPGTDAFELSAAGFGGGLAAGQDLGATGQFVANAEGATTSASGTGQFVYATGAGRLLWDADGSGGADAVLLATLEGTPALGAADLRIIA